MTEEEQREQTAMNMAMIFAYKVGFRAGMDFREEHGEEAEKKFTGGIFSEGDSGDRFIYITPFSKIPHEEYAKVFQRIIEKVRERLQEFGDDKNKALNHAWIDLQNDPYVIRVLLEVKRLSNA